MLFIKEVSYLLVGRVRHHFGQILHILFKHKAWQKYTFIYTDLFWTWIHRVRLWSTHFWGILSKNNVKIVKIVITDLNIFLQAEFHESFLRDDEKHNIEDYL